MSRTPFRFAEGTAVVTGAAGGMGEHVARLLAERGSDLVLADRDGDRLETVATAIRERHPGLSVTTETVDLADRDAVDALAGRIRAGHPEVRLLVNNAGVALGGDFARLTLDEFDWVMDVNFRAPVRLTHALLPALTARPGAHVVNVSSLFGLIGPPGQSAYSSSKYALRGFSEVLRAELAQVGAGVTTVHPGGIRTNIARSARVGVNIPAAEAEKGQRDFDKLLTFPADRAAELIVEAVAKRRPRLLIGASARIPDALARIAPAHGMTLLSRLLGASARRPATAGAR
ncbi:Short-chain dehydrogenase/reductase SDR [Pseudonocardia sp. Ae168_Ps1]|uniref:SDR family NAD(P)-dependent oxidoreductase n=1 Tax=unclassified Pseudonocardia TaxID=2619320 RepID=UPI00094AC98A|nr:MULTISPECIES: SDR family NAD(P)-dependent oxidoreductase [unclassified Pseudonocardia]OLL71802.1 Short-chain dehydrogenase/reductase SDR [Pseudonocardia sp. Ae150A_Ps1]OLL77769.1 Short-chain dehydrogenase/reductase SDR [Pseudonocardia sp. Ae168_Ps1]OLL88107.1 Short-chain dehydrogenase/reductase SDR [Pseudonocardia sp. Ae263_Ps1]OLL91867.1 Short-chain dehydrogenase/reductase SDR [Pseudonocardia sp. Ae356_Ps1]